MPMIDIMLFQKISGRNVLQTLRLVETRQKITLLILVIEKEFGIDTTGTFAAGIGGLADDDAMVDGGIEDDTDVKRASGVNMHFLKNKTQTYIIDIVAREKESRG
jgi:hypothetical protein